MNKTSIKKEKNNEKEENQNLKLVFEELKKEYYKKKPDKKEFQKIKLKLSKKYGLKKTPTNIEFLMHLPSEDLENEKIIRPLTTKPVREKSGVNVVAVMTEPRLCPHGKCIYCPGGPKSELGDVPMAYTGQEPASMRGERTNYDAYLQVFTRLEQYIAAGHIPQKIELIIMGGTLPSYEDSYQYNFIKDCFNAMNDFSKMFFKNKNEIDYKKFKEFFELPGSVEDEKRVKNIHKKILVLKQKNNNSLEEAQKYNDKKSYVKIVGMTLETRPDFSMFEHANKMLEQGTTRVELGVQSVYEEILEFTGRSHGTKESIEATRILKDLGFKINYHLMPGLPNVTYEKDLEGLKEIFKNSDYKPDMIKLYPTGVFPGTVLYDYYKLGLYKPLRVDDAVKLLSEFKTTVPRYCRIMRVQRDIPSKMLVDGVLKTNLRQIIKNYMKEKNMKCNCIRCREIGLNKQTKKPKYEIKIIEYEASKGKEYFISYEDTNNDLILGFVRLRFPSQTLRKEITKKTALIRELHVYGRKIELGKKGKKEESSQHQGIGKKLMEKAEKIAKKEGYEKILVISGIGVREYYRKIGYKLEGPYMSKKL